MSGIAAGTLSDHLVSAVRNLILAGHISEERSIRQESLASQLGVSKIPLREALTRLQLEGLVEARANHGFFVRSLSAGEAEEVCDLRLALEPEAVAFAAGSATPSDHLHAEDALVRLDAAIAAYRSDVGELNRAFHLALIRPAGQVITIGILERLHVLSERYVRAQLSPAGRNQRANAEHRAMLDAWCAGDGSRVAELVAAHIVDVRRDLLDGFERAGSFP